MKKTLYLIPISFVFLIYYFISVNKSIKLTNAGEKAVQFDSAVKSHSEDTEQKKILDTINGIPLVKLTNFKLHNGKVREYVYGYQNRVTYGTKEQWENLHRVSKNDYHLNFEKLEDTTKLPTVSNGNLQLTPNMILKSDTIENYAYYKPLAYLNNRRILVFSKLGYHKITYFAFDKKLQKIDTLNGYPYRVGSYLSCYDEELHTDSPHEFRLFKITDKGLILIDKFSLKYLFGLRPVELLYQNDNSVLFYTIKNFADNTRDTLFWKYSLN